MVASSVKSKQAESFESQSVGNPGYLNRHNTQMFQEGRSFSGNERDKLWIGNGDASFVDLSDLSGADSANDGRAVIAADLDDDGALSGPGGAMDETALSDQRALPVFDPTSASASVSAPTTGGDPSASPVAFRATRRTLRIKATTFDGRRPDGSRCP